MLSKELFKKEIKELLTMHYLAKDVDVDFLKLWYEECKEINDEDFITAIRKARYSPREPRLYDILSNLPQYNKEKDKTIHEYCKRLKNEETKRKRIYVPIDPTM